MADVRALTARGRARRDQRAPWLLAPTLFGAMLLLGLPSALAEPVVIHVRGRARLTSEARNVAGGMVLFGKLVDSDRDEPLGLRDIVVEVEGIGLRRLRTDEQGGFATRLPAAVGQYKVRVRFAGGGAGEYAPTVEEKLVDVAKERLDLVLEGPSRLALEEHDALFVVTASARAEPQQVAVELRARGMTVAHGTTNSSGRAELQVDLRKLPSSIQPGGQPGGTTATRAGPLTISCHFRGDEVFNPAEAQLKATLFARTRLEAKARTNRVAADGVIRVRARARDFEGAVAQATVTLTVDGRTVATALTDARGEARLNLFAEEFRPGLLQLRAELLPAEAWRLNAPDVALALTVLAPRPIPLGYLVAPPLITLLIVLGFSVRNLRPRLRRGKKNVPPVTSDKPLAGGLVSSRSALRGRLRTLLGTETYEISGSVWDASSDEPVAHARLELVARHASLSATEIGTDLAPDATTRDLPPTLAVADARGRFRFAPVGGATPQPTQLELVVTAGGYVTERITVTLPHRGELTDARILLVPVRVRLLELYRVLALELLPRATLWGLWTPRELGHHVRRARPSVDPPLRPLTELFERVYYGVGPAEEARLVEARHLVESVASQLQSDRRPSAAERGASHSPSKGQ